ncbi:LOW QUALITY PROTEIN: proline-rich protein 18-like [Papio anubis]|uniref:LOW QUALITY PROTEIN: proline-rich protein 18-like n=1 Tax=Papio anubis TaxID=9555 RepID=UPI0012AD7C09|nr:LOW QUALITY PROTEIN: proline-rich protein 18-like [Papio anubis]
MPSAPGASPTSPAGRPALTSSPPPPPSLTDAPASPASRPPPPPARRWRPAASGYSSASGTYGPAARLGAEAQGEAPRGPRAVGGSGGAGEPPCRRWSRGPAQRERLLSCLCCFPSFFTGSCSFRTSWSAFTLELTSSIPARLPPSPAAHSLSQQQGKSRRKEASPPLTPAEAPACSRTRPRRQGPPSSGPEVPLAPAEPPPRRRSEVQGGSTNIWPLPPSSLRPPRVAPIRKWRPIKVGDVPRSYCQERTEASLNQVSLTPEHLHDYATLFQMLLYSWYSYAIFFFPQHYVFKTHHVDTCSPSSLFSLLYGILFNK